MLTVTLVLEDEEGVETTEELPARHEVCPDCEGHGTVLNAAIRQHAYSREEFEEEFSDEEDRAAYFRRGGHYDVPCPTCGGVRVVPVVAEDRLAPAQVVFYAAWQAREEEKARWDAEAASEARWERRMMGDW